MKRKITNSTILAIMLIVLINFTGCKKDDSSSNNGNNNPPPATITDIDGNVYHTIKIGTQYWLLENLKTTKFRNGTPIPIVTDNTAWAALSTAAYCYYNNNTAVVTNYGHLYNWHAISDTRNICPLGWHVPNYAEWDLLINYLGGDPVAGGKLKEAGEAHWSSPNMDASNSSGFTALPGGRRGEDGVFFGGGQLGGWWSNSLNILNDEPEYLDLLYYYGGASISSDLKAMGYSVRCIRD